MRRSEYNYLTTYISPNPARSPHPGSGFLFCIPPAAAGASSDKSDPSDPSDPSANAAISEWSPHGISSSSDRPYSGAFHGPVVSDHSLMATPCGEGIRLHSDSFLCGIRYRVVIATVWGKGQFSEGIRKTPVLLRFSPAERMGFDLFLQCLKIQIC